MTRSDGPNWARPRFQAVARTVARERRHRPLFLRAVAFAEARMFPLSWLSPRLGLGSRACRLGSDFRIEADASCGLSARGGTAACGRNNRILERRGKERHV